MPSVRRRTTFWRCNSSITSAARNIVPDIPACPLLRPMIRMISASSRSRAVSGGRGNLWGVFLGLLLLATINPALTYLRIDAYWEKAIQGAVILFAVLGDGLRNRRAAD